MSEPPGSFEICEVCGWEDDAVQLANPTSGGGANRESLVEAQARVLREVAIDLSVRDGAWRPLSEEEIGWHREQTARSDWPNRADGLCYWQHPVKRD